MNLCLLTRWTNSTQNHNIIQNIYLYLKLQENTACSRGFHSKLKCICLIYACWAWKLVEHDFWIFSPPPQKKIGYEKHFCQTWKKSKLFKIALHGKKFDQRQKNLVILDSLNGRQTRWKTTSMEDNLNGKQP